MHIVQLCPDSILPANRGGRVDQWRRLQGLVAAGVKVTLVNSEENNSKLRPQQQEYQTIDNLVHRHETFRVHQGRGGALKILNAARLPWHVAARTPEPKRFRELLDAIALVRADYLLLEGPWLGELALAARAETGIKLLYRSANIEHQYMFGQGIVSKGLATKLSLIASTIGLLEYQLHLMRKSTHVFDISADDIVYWKSKGIYNISWLPPICETPVIEPAAKKVISDVAFIGNLATPNNVKSVLFLVEKVLPILRSKINYIDLIVVGSNPSESLIAILKRNHVKLYSNVEDTLPFRTGSKVLVNPVATGSGVQLKTIDMLMSDSPIVTHPQGLRGLPDDIKRNFLVAKSPIEFSEKILFALTNGKIDTEERIKCRKIFAAENITSAFLEKI